MTWARVGDVLGSVLQAIEEGEPLELALDPPYESPIEYAFAYQAVRYLRPIVRLEKQVQTLTRWGNFRLDFMIYCGNRRIGVECDGRAFHDPWRDSYRDALILGSGIADVIYRMPGGALNNAPEACMYGLAHCEPSVFSPRALPNLSHLVTPRMRTLTEAVDADGFDVVAETEDGGCRYFVRRHDLAGVPGRYNRLRSFFEFALSRSERTLDDLIAVCEGGRAAQAKW